MSPSHAEQSVLMSPPEAQQTALMSPPQAQYYGSSPQPQSPLLIPSNLRSSPVSPNPGPLEHIPDLSDMVEDLDFLLDNIVTDGGKTKGAKQKSRKEVSEKVDIVAQMSKLNM